MSVCFLTLVPDLFWYFIHFKFAFCCIYENVICDDVKFTAYTSRLQSKFHVCIFFMRWETMVVHFFSFTCQRSNVMGPLGNSRHHCLDSCCGDPKVSPPTRLGPKASKGRCPAGRLIKCRNLLHLIPFNGEKQGLCSKISLDTGTFSSISNTFVPQWKLILATHIPQSFTQDSYL